MYERSERTWLGTITLNGLQHARLDAAVAAKAHKTGASWQTDWTPEDYFRERCEVFGSWISSWIKRFRQAEVRRSRADAMRHVFVWNGGIHTIRQLTGPRNDGFSWFPSLACKVRYGKHVAPPAEFSYLLVAEKHKSGRPHWHVLLHEKHAFALIRSAEYYVTRKGVVRVDDKAMIRKHWRFGFTQFELCRDHRSAGYLCKYLAKDMLWRVRASIGYGEEIDDQSKSDIEGR